MVLKNKRVRFVLFAFVGLVVGSLHYLWLEWVKEDPAYTCSLRSNRVTIIKAKHAIPEGTILSADMVELETVSERFTTRDALVGRNIHIYVNRRMRVGAWAGEHLEFDHIYEPQLPARDIRYY